MQNNVAYGPGAGKSFCSRAKHSNDALLALVYRQRFASSWALSCHGYIVNGGMYLHPAGAAI